MSLNKLSYDKCSYEQVLGESLGPGFYQLTTPPNSCKPCHSTDPRIRLQSTGVSLNRDSSLVDIDSELLGITRNASSCSSRKFNPYDQCLKDSKLCIEVEKTPIDFDDCFINTEDTRLSNPPCNLRGTGWNRWEWLCKNPQENIEEPFDTLIDSRTLSKINHRPCVPTPIDQYEVYPDVNEKEECDTIIGIKNTCAVPTSPPSIQWQSLDRINNY
jgi:hypothetical protein